MKKKKILIVILSIIIVGGISFGIYTYLQNQNELEEVEEKEKISEEPTEEETIENESIENSYEDSPYYDNTIGEYKNSSNYKINYKNCLNNKEYYYKEDNNRTYHGFNMSISNNKKEINLTINPYIMWNRNEGTTHSKITGINSNIKSIFVGLYGQANYYAILALTEDNSIYYILLPEYNENNEQVNIKSEYIAKKINLKTSDVIGFASVSVSNTKYNVGGWAGIIAVRSDGSFYDITFKAQ